jgi:CheY-like chemotaxis protein
VQLRGYATESAFSGSEALEKVRDHVPDVVFLDLMLPDLDGYAVCRALKASGTTSQVPIVIVTARIAAENRIESFHAGADDYVPKPYTPDQIFEALDQSSESRLDHGDSCMQGDVVLDGRDDGETLRRLARLRSLLLARSGLEPEAIDRISAAISAIWSNVDAWARRSGLDQVATLAFAVSPEKLVLTVHDEAGWLSTVGDRTVSAVSPVLTDAGFDQVETDREARCLRLVKRFNAL